MQEEFGLATTSTPTPICDHSDSTTVSSSQPTPVLIYSTTTTTSVPPNLIPISDAMREILRYALNLGPHPVSSPQQSMVQTTISVQVPISSPVVNPSPTFDVHLDVGDLEFLQKKLGKSKGKLGSALPKARGENPYVKVVSALEQSLGEST